MGKTFRFILQCAVVLLLSQTGFARTPGVAMAAHQSEFATCLDHHQVATGVMYEVGKYPGKHKFFMHKKVVNPFSGFTINEAWTVPTRIPVSDIHYFSLLYRSHISAILNSNDLLRGPPVVIA